MSGADGGFTALGRRLPRGTGDEDGAPFSLHRSLQRRMEARGEAVLWTSCRSQRQEPSREDALADRSRGQLVGYVLSG